MSEERYDIEIQDKVDPQISNKLALIAAEARNAHTAVQKLKSELKLIDVGAVSRLNKELSSNATATARMQKEQALAAKAAAQLATEQQKLAAETQKTASATVAATARAELATQRMQKEQTLAAKAAAQLATEQQKLATETQRTAAATARAELATQRIGQSHERAGRAGQVHTEVMKKLGDQSKLTRAELLTIHYTINDVAASLASGGSPFTILMQQGGQVTQAFGGLRATLSRIGAMMTTTAGIVGMLAAAVGLYVMAVNSASKENAAFQNALTITNGYAGLTTSSFEVLTEKIANSANVSVASAKAVVMQLTQSGKFQKEQIDELGYSAVRLSQFTGKSADDVIKDFTRMANGPAAYAKELNGQLHFLDAAQISHIKKLEEMGEKSEATRVLSKALYDYLGSKSPAQLGYLERAWIAVGKAISNAWTWLKKFGSEETPASKLKGLQEELARLENPNAPFPNNRMTPQKSSAIANLKEEIATIEQKIKAEEGAAKAQADALAAEQRKIEQIEANEKKAKEIAKYAEMRAKALLHVRTELKAEISTYGMLGSELEYQTKLNQIMTGLTDKKITLTSNERKEIEGLVRTSIEQAQAQEYLNRVYEQAVGPSLEYNRVTGAAQKLLSDGKINVEQYDQAFKRAVETYEAAVNPLKGINRELDQQIQLMRIVGPARNVAAQIQAVENQLKAQGLGLGAQERADLTKKLTLLERQTQQMQAVDAIYSETTGKQIALGDAVRALNFAYQQGVFNADAYGLRLNNLGKEALNTKLNMQTASFEEGMLASIGRVTDGYHGMIEGLSASFGDFFANVNDGFANSVGHAIAFGDSISDAIGDAARNAVSSLIGALIKLGIQYVVNAALGQSLASAAVATSAAEAAALGAVWATPAALASLATLGTNAVPAMAALAGTVGMSQGLALAGMAGFEKGGYTGDFGRKEVAGVVHGQEFVMNAEATARNRPALEAMNRGATPSSVGSGNVGSSGGVSVNIENYGTSKDFEVQQISASEVRIIARDEARNAVSQHAPGVVAADMNNPNGRVSKALSRNTQTQRKR